MDPVAASPLRRTLDHYAGRGVTRPWTAKPQREPGCTGPPSLLELCTEKVAQSLHTLPSLDVLPHHILKEVLDRRKNESMTDADIPLLLSTTFDVIPVDQVDFLSFKNCHKVTEEGINVVFDNCPSLRSLDLSFCELMSDTALKDLSIKCSQLQELDLTGCRLISDTGCASLARLKGLTSIRLELCNKVTDVGVQSIVRSVGPVLKELNLGDVRQMTNISVQIIADHCTGLTSLSIAGNMQADESDEVTKYARKMAVFREMCVEDGRVMERFNSSHGSGVQVMDMDVADVCKKCLHMQSLNLRACRRLTDGCLKPISAMLRGQHKRGIPALTALDLGGCGRLSDDALCNMLPLCSSLTLLDLRGCKNLTVRSQDLIGKYCPSMIDLTFPKLPQPETPP